MFIYKLWSIVFYSITLFICFGLPLVLAIYLRRKEQVPVKAVLVGVVIFLVFQLLNRIPLIAYLQGTTWFFQNVALNIWNSAAFYALSAGLFEEGGRFIAFKYWLKCDLNWASGVAYGIGHGGCEAVYIGILFISGVGNIYAAAPTALLFPGIERLFALLIQIALSLIVLYGVKKGKYIFLLYAILLHTLVDAPIVLVRNPLILEPYVFLMALVSLVFIIKTKPFPQRV